MSEEDDEYINPIWERQSTASRWSPQLEADLVTVARFTETIDPWFREEFEKQSQGDDIIYDLAVVGGADGPVLLLSVFISGAIFGTKISCSLAIQQPAALMVENVPQIVKDALEGLRTGRSQQLQAPQHETGLSNLLTPR